MGESNYEHHTESETTKDHLIVETVSHPTPTTLERETLGSTAEEHFLRFCIEHFENPERSGNLPKAYSPLNPEQLKDVKEAVVASLTEGKTDDIAKYLNQLYTREQNGEVLNESEVALLRISEGIALAETHRARAAIVHNSLEAKNPLGELGNVTLLIFSDLHHAPTSLENEVREQAFKRYGPFRAVSKLADIIAEGSELRGIKGVVTNKTDTRPGLEGAYKRFILRETALAQYRSWLEEVVNGGYYTQQSDEILTPLLVSLGDLVHDGASLDAQVAERSALREIIDSTAEQGTKLIEVNGNHDNDSRVPESVSMSSEIYGEGIFTQEVAGGVLIVGLDTNIENPEWVKEFSKKAGEDGMAALENRRALQQQAIERMTSYEGPVVLMGHNPSRLIEALAVNSQVIQNSNVQRIVAGHTHKETHVVLPITNKSGDPIVMDVVESFVRVSGGKPQPPKLYAIDIVDGKIKDLRTMHEPENTFSRAIEERI